MAHEKRFWGLYDPNTDSWHFKGLTLKKRSLQIRLPKKHLASRTAEFVVVLVAGMILSALIASEYLGIGIGSIFISAGVIMAGAIIAVTIYYILKSPVQKEGVRLYRRVFTPEEKQAQLEKQGGKCIYCGVSKSLLMMDGDHVKPFSKRGKTHKLNLQILCKDCNHLKGTLSDRTFRERYEEAGIPQITVSRQKPPPPVPPIDPSKLYAVAEKIAAKKKEDRIKKVATKRR